MFVRQETLSPEALAELKALAGEVHFVKAESHRRRMGANMYAALSIYNYSRWYLWNADQRKRFKASMPDKPIKKSVVGWYIHFPAEEGFLDVQTYWADERMSGTAVSFALNDNQTIIIGDDTVTLNAGEGI